MSDVFKWWDYDLMMKKIGRDLRKYDLSQKRTISLFRATKLINDHKDVISQFEMAEHIFGDDVERWVFILDSLHEPSNRLDEVQFRAGRDWVYSEAHRIFKPRSRNLNTIDWFFRGKD